MLDATGKHCVMNIVIYILTASGRRLNLARVKMLCWLGWAIDIHSKGKWPSNVLSNFYENSFELDGVWCRSMEGFLQGLKCPDIDEQVSVCAMPGKAAKKFGQSVKANPDYDIESHGVNWQGQQIDRHSGGYLQLVRRAYNAMSAQCPQFRQALAATGAKQLHHTIGNPNPRQTILTEKEFCSTLLSLRDNLPVKS